MAKPQQVAIVTDSSVSLPSHVLEQWGIAVAPLEVHFGQHTYRDGEDLGPAAFYQMLLTADPLPTTSAPKPASFLDAYRKASALADHVLCLTLASRLSAVHDSAQVAAQTAVESLPQVRVQVVDSHTAASAQALVVLAAAKAAHQGGAPAAVLHVCNRAIEKVNFLAFLDTLHYVWKSGRIPRVAAWAGDLLNVKPLLELTMDDIHLVARPRTRPRATDALVNIMAQRTKGRPVVVNVFHAADPDGAERLHQRVQAEFSCQDSFVSEFSPALGAHTGPGVLGLAFYVAE